MGLLELKDESLPVRRVLDDDDCEECCSSACGSAQCCDDDACSEVSFVDCACPSQGVRQQSQVPCRDTDVRCCSIVSECEQGCLPCEDTSCQNDDVDYVCCTGPGVVLPPNTIMSGQTYDTFYDTHGFRFEDFAVPGLPGLARSSSSTSAHQYSNHFNGSTSTTALLDSSAVSMVSSCSEPSESYHCVSHPAVNKP